MTLPSLEDESFKSPPQLQNTPFHVLSKQNSPTTHLTSILLCVRIVIKIYTMILQGYFLSDLKLISTRDY